MDVLGKIFDIKSGHLAYYLKLEAIWILTNIAASGSDPHVNLILNEEKIMRPILDILEHEKT